MADVRVDKLHRRIGELDVLHKISFDVRDGEFMTLLGPSGCGKSTTLSAIAGLEPPTGGRVTIGGRVVADPAARIFIDARERGLGLMFQSYALWPHMTVGENLDFTLQLRRIRGAQAKARIDECLALVEMGPYRDRYPAELSGGQQQRVALARTLVYRPQILLLDEPLSNLDAKLRDRARDWLRELQRRTKVTTIYVTHDQGEALAISDRIIVMHGGRIEQSGTPEEIYESPSSVFVADFVGSSNLFDATLARGDAGGFQLVLSGDARIAVRSAPEGAIGRPVRVAIRPERIELRGRGQKLGPNEIPIQPVERSYQGSRTVHLIKAGPLLLRAEAGSTVPDGELVARLPPEALMVFAGQRT